MLLSESIATEFCRMHGWRKFDRAEELLDAIEHYLASKGLSGSSINRFDVARHVVDLRVESAAEESLTTEVVREGWGDQRPDLDELAMQRANELALLERVQQTPMSDWARERQNYFGLGKTTLDHLAGL